MKRITRVALTGDVHGSGSGTVLGLATQVEARSCGDVYGNGFYWAAGLGYRVGEAGEIRVQGSYTANPADRLQVGAVAGLPLFALFDDYKAFGMDFGYRQYFGDANDLDGLAGTGLESINDESRRWSMPITGGITVRF